MSYEKMLQVVTTLVCHPGKSVYIAALMYIYSPTATTCWIYFAECIGSKLTIQPIECIFSIESSSADMSVWSDSNWSKAWWSDGKLWWLAFASLYDFQRQVPLSPFFVEDGDPTHNLYSVIFVCYEVSTEPILKLFNLTCLSHCCLMAWPCVSRCCKPTAFSLSIIFYSFDLMPKPLYFLVVLNTITKDTPTDTTLWYPKNILLMIEHMVWNNYEIAEWAHCPPLESVFETGYF